MDVAGSPDMFEDFDPESHPGVQFLPAVDASGDGAENVPGPAPDDPLERLREDLRRLAADLDAVNRRDAAQHGGLKGEIAHLVRRIARLEAMPKPRPVR